MEQKRIVVTVTRAVQVGPDKWQQDYQSRVFATTRSIDDMLAWAKGLGFTNPTVNDLQISDYTGESI